MNDLLPRRTDILDQVLDRVHPPVARFRVVSAGLARNHTLKTDTDLAGTRACLACGNCVDACPVVAGKPKQAMFVRTSMLLETVVGSECRRCYKCVAACPQVSRPVKDYARSFRRVERVSHWDFLVSYLILMTTGILLNHWGSELPEDLRAYAGGIHRLIAIALIAAPLFMLVFDRHHFALAARRAVSWSRSDAEWFRETWRWLTSLGKEGSLNRGAFNPGQRFWYLYVPSVVVVFALTGILKWLGPAVVGQQAVAGATAIHVAAAFATDVLLTAHIYFKLGWPTIRDIVRGTRQQLELQRRRQAEHSTRTASAAR